MAKKLICPKCDYENREGTPKCLICSTDLKGQKTVETSLEESSSKQSATEPNNPIESTTETVETEKEDENLIAGKTPGYQTGQTEGDESSGQKQRRKISPIRIIIYVLLAGYWIWFGITQCGVKETIS